MRKRTQFLKKALALVLSFLMMLSPCAPAIAATLHSHTHAMSQQLYESTPQEDDGKWHGTTGTLISANYELSDAEKAILACTALRGETYSVEIPVDNSDGHVTVDAENQIVTALPYETDGFEWVPTKAILKYFNTDGTPGTDIEVPLEPAGEAYVGSFQKPTNSYHVEVTYALYIEVDPAVQEFFLETPFDLVDGYHKMIGVSYLSTVVTYINTRMDDLRMLYEGVHYSFEHDGEEIYSYSLGLEENSAIKKAIGDLIADYDKSENNNRLTLSKDIADFTAASNKVKFMLENGQKIKDDLAWFCDKITTIDENSADLIALVEEIEHLATGTGENTVAEAKDKIDEIVEQELPGLVDKAYNENWPKLEEALEEVFQNGLKSDNKYYDQLKDIVPSDFAGLQAEIDQVYNEAWPKLEDALEEVFAEGLKPSNPYYDQLKDIIPSDFAGLQAEVDKAYNENWPKLEDALEDVVDNGLKSDNEYYDQFKELLPANFKGLIPTINEKVEEAKVQYAQYIQDGYIELDSLKDKGLFTTPTIYAAIDAKREDLDGLIERERKKYEDLGFGGTFDILVLPTLLNCKRDANQALDELENAVESVEDEYKTAKTQAQAKLREAIEDEAEAKIAEIKAEAQTKLRETIEDEAEAKIAEIKAEAQVKLRQTIESEARKEADKLVAEKKAELDELAQTALEKAHQIDSLVSGSAQSTPMHQLASMVKKENNQTWLYLGKEFVKSGVTTDEYAALDTAVKAGIDPITEELLVTEHPDVTIKEKLFACETVISAYVDQQVVSVEVKAEVVPKGSVDSTELISLDVFTTTLALDVDSDAQSILRAITDSGVEHSALTQWDSFYNVGTDNYHRNVSVQDKSGTDLGELGSLTQDIRYVITYTPKNYTIKETYLPAGSDVTEVPYGYNWCLPRPTDPAKSYDYKVNGVAQRESTIYRVVENIEVSRTEGKALVSKSLAELIVMSKDPGQQLSDKEKSVLLSNCFLVDTVYFRTPDSEDALTEVTVDGTGYKLTARAMDAGIVGMNALWIPVSAVPVLATRASATEFGLTSVGPMEYEGSFDCDGVFTSVQVTYRLSIDGLGAQTVLDLMNIANTLEMETRNQKTTLDRLCHENNFYNNLANLTSSILGSVSSLVTDMTPAAKEALHILTAECINPDTAYSYLYEYLTQYNSENGGLSYYYKGDNAKKLQAQIDLINHYLPIVWHDQPVRDYIADMSNMQSQFDKVERMVEQLATVDLMPVNALVDTNSPFVDTLLAAVLQEDNTSLHTGPFPTVALETTLSAVAPGQTSYGVKIRVLNKNGAEVNSFTQESFRAQGDVVTVDEFRQLYELLLTQIPNAQYYTVQTSLPTADVTLGAAPVLYTSDLSPRAYTVKIEGEADQTIYAFDAYTITLSGTGNPGLKYVYHIGNSEVEVASGSLENFSLGLSIEEIEALFGSDYELQITRDVIDINKENLLNFIESFNKALVNAGLVVGNNLEIALIPMQDAQGNLSVVLRVAKGNTELSVQELANEVLSLAKDLSYVGLNGSPFFALNAENELKLYLQTLIQFVTNSGVGLETLTTIFDDNGDIVEMQLPGYSAVGATGNDILVIGKSKINDVDQLGGKLIESTLQYGISASNATSVPFYVTLQDFDKKADIFRQLKKGASQIRPYLDLSLAGGAVNATVNAPDSAYAYLLTALLMVGEVDFETLQSYQLDQIVEYFFSLIDPAFADETISATTFINTLKKTGFYDAIDRFDIEAHKSLMQTVYNLTDHVYDAVTLTGSSVGGLYEGVLQYNSLEAIFNKNASLAAFRSMIAEISTGLELPITFHLKNRDQKYEALILDVRADGILNKYHLSRDAASDIALAKDQAVVVLLSDVNSDITFNHDVILNLNGYTIHGDLTAKGAVTIVDSTLDTVNCGGVTGNLIASGGTFNVSAGNYQDDIQSYLEPGYVLENNVVTNGLFRLEQNGTDLNLYLGSDALAANKSTAKVMAVDLLSKLLMNYYACSELLVDGNRIYGVNLTNVTESLDTRSVLIEKVLDCISFPGSSAFATQLLEDITDFAGLAKAIEDGTALVSYTIEHSAFNPYVTYEGSGEDDFFSLNVTSSDHKLCTKLNVFVSEDVLDGHKELACQILRELDRITSFEELKIDIQDASYGKDGLNVDGAAIADVVLDLSVDENYPIILAAILAENEIGAERQKWIDAILDYQTSSSSTALKAMLDAASAADLMAALEKTGSMKFSAILSDLGLSAPDANELESKYTIVRKVVGKALDYLNKTGPSKTLGSLAVSGQYATYSYSIEKSSDVYAKATLKLFAEEKAIVVKDEDGNVVLKTDDLAAALQAVLDGGTIYINDEIKLTEDLAILGVEFTIEKATNINFNGKFLYLNNGNTVLKVDRDIAAFLKTGDNVVCSDIVHTTEAGFHKFLLHGDGHLEVPTAPIPATCSEYGWKDGTHCQYCNKVIVEPTRVDKLPHTEVKIPAIPATCTEDGWTEGKKCSVCGEVLVSPTKIDKLGHTEEKISAIPATCTEDGWTEGKKCSVCGEVLVAPTKIDKLGHVEVPTAPIPATCSEYGWKDGTHCQRCNEVLVQPTRVNKLPHSEETIPAVPVSCTQDGWTEGKKCSVCGEVLVHPVKINKLPHSEEEIPAVPATETTPGSTAGVKCSVCGEVLVHPTELKLLPKIHVPTVNVVTPDGLIRGAKVDVANKLIFLDADPSGLKASDFGLVHFEIDNETSSTTTLSSVDGSVIRTGGDLICTGDKVVVWAENADHVEVSVTYTIIMMGDANCDGKLNARDLVMIKMHFVGDLTMGQISILAADMNFDGNINARDSVACDTKFAYWSDNAYVSLTR